MPAGGSPKLLRWCSLRLLLSLSSVFFARASTVLAPARLRGPLASTTWRFFGPQTFSLNTTGLPLIELDARDLARLEKTGRAWADLTGAVVLLNLGDVPGAATAALTEGLYRTLEQAQVAAVLGLAGIATKPGYATNAHDGSYGKRVRHRALPALQLTEADVRPLLASMRAGETVSLILEPTENAWLRLWQGWPWIVVMRALVPSLAFTAGAMAVINLRAHLLLGRRLDSESVRVHCPPPKPVTVLAAEALVCPALGVFYMVGPYWSSAIWPAWCHRLGFSGLSGWGLWTTAMMAVRPTRRSASAQPISLVPSPVSS